MSRVFAVSQHGGGKFGSGLIVFQTMISSLFVQGLALLSVGVGSASGSGSSTLWGVVAMLSLLVGLLILPRLDSSELASVLSVAILSTASAYAVTILVGAGVGVMTFALVVVLSYIKLRPIAHNLVLCLGFGGLAIAVGAFLQPWVAFVGAIMVGLVGSRSLSLVSAGLTRQQLHRQSPFVFIYSSSLSVCLARPGKISDDIVLVSAYNLLVPAAVSVSVLTGLGFMPALATALSGIVAGSLMMSRPVRERRWMLVVTVAVQVIGCAIVNLLT